MAKGAKAKLVVAYRKIALFQTRYSHVAKNKTILQQLFLPGRWLQASIRFATKKLKIAWDTWENIQLLEGFGLAIVAFLCWKDEGAINRQDHNVGPILPCF